MAVRDAPTRPRGSLSGAAQGSLGEGIDPAEFVPDLMWPESVRTYGRMRHDPTITSALAAYTHPIIKGRWRVDPRGADPRIVAIVADSLGIPVLGQPDEPGPVRRRGVRWRQHLRMASLALVYGHMPFYPWYEVRAGAAYLGGLPERLPTSLLQIVVDADGNLEYVEQEPAPDMRGQARAVRLPAGELLWYANDREGAAWYGRSILRASFGPWLLKQDQMRISATGQRRFGTPVPTAEVLPGFTPTQGELTAAAAAVAQVRVGDEAGIALPPGFRLRLVGAEGAPPDGLPLLRYYDEQMARSMLASVLDLGNTSNGSRALGSSFLDVLGFALQSVAETIAETATELAVRLTDYNAGPDAAAPAIVVGDVAGSEEALAVTVGELLKSGALTADPELEAWVREAYRLPERPKDTAADPGDQRRRDVAETIQKTYLGVGTVVTSDEARQIVNQAGASLPVPGPPELGARRPGAGGAVAAASAPEPLLGKGSAVPAWPYRRPLSAVEAAAGFDPETLDAVQARVLGDLLRAWPSVQADWRDQLGPQIAAAVDTGNLTDLAAVDLDLAAAVEVVAVAVSTAWDGSAALAAAEAAQQGQTVTAPEAADDAVRAVARSYVAVIATGVIASAAREALRLAGPGVTGTEVAGGVTSFLAGLSGSTEVEVLGGAVSAGISEARAAVAASAPAPVTRWVASEIRDPATCGPCAEHDGREYPDFAAAAKDYPTGGYRGCLGRYRCRGVLIPVWE